MAAALGTNSYTWAEATGISRWIVLHAHVREKVASRAASKIYFRCEVKSSSNSRLAAQGVTWPLSTEDCKSFSRADTAGT